MTKKALRKYYRFVKFLRKNFPLYLRERKYGTDIRRVNMKDSENAGECTCEGRRRKFVIRIDKSLSIESTYDTLIHEYAHAMTWDEFESLDSEHFDNWGIAYAKVYRVYEEFIGSI